MKTSERRQTLKDTLIAAAERSITAHGITGLKARDLAAEAGCAVGAIYNVFTDLDDLILAVNTRTLATLQTNLIEAAYVPQREGRTTAEAVTQLVHLAHAYLHFAAANTGRWRAVFDHNLPEGRGLPDAYREQQHHLFTFIEQPLRVLHPDSPPEELTLLARSLFSAVHGIIVLGLEEKLGTVSLVILEKQLALVLNAVGTGLANLPLNVSSFRASTTN